MSKPYDPPIKVSIPTPSHIPRTKGIYSTAGYGGNLRVRCTNSEHDLVQEEATRLGLSLAGFSRWCITRVASALKQHREEQSTSHTVEVEVFYVEE